MNLKNISNNRREVTLFCREADGTLRISKDNTYFPYYYQEDKNGTATTIDGKKVKKIVCSEPKDVIQQRNSNSYEADINFSKRYIIDKIAKFDKTCLKYFFLDIEVLSTDLPDTMLAPDPVSCITVYNSLSDSIHTWYMGDAKYDVHKTHKQKEQALLQDFVNYVRTEKPDLLLAWNIDFDYTYLHQRYKNFAKAVSPIGEERYGTVDGIKYPAGISVVDFMAMFKKIYMREQSYALDNISQKYLNEAPWPKTPFNVLNEMMKKKNVNDVQRMLALEKKLNILDYYDEIRRFATCTWEDLTANSRVLDMVVLREANKKSIILPTKKKRDENAVELELEGAYRRAEAGVYKNIYKADIVSMYPSQMVNFCLDPQNITDCNDPQALNIDGLWIRQNEQALIPSITKDLMKLKDDLKKQLRLETNEQEQKILQNKYAAIKGLVNSLYGIIGFRGFRLFNNEIASRITSLSRELLHYVEDKMKEFGFEVIYTDTDALMYKAEQDEIDLLNKLVYDWAIETYNKDDINIRFESEDKFKSLLILTKCRYYGIFDDDKVEVKGMEMKRSNSSKYEANYQKQLVNLILADKSKQEIRQWVDEKVKDIVNEDLNNLAFPAKVANKVYQNKPIFIRAYETTQKFVPTFKLNKGELFHYIFVKDYGKDENKKEMNVLVLTDEVKDLKSHLDWEEIIRRNIMMKTDAIFEALYKEPYSVRASVPVAHGPHKPVVVSSILTPATIMPGSQRVAVKEGSTPRPAPKRGRPKKIDGVAPLIKEQSAPSAVEQVGYAEPSINLSFPYFSTDKGRCYNASCLELFKALPTDSCQMMFTSPPYNTGNKGKNKDMYTEYKDNLSDEDYFKLLDTVVKEGMRICKGPVFFNINYMNNNKKVLYRLLHENSEFLRENIIWKKDRVQPPIGNILGKRYEYIFVFTKDPKVEINNFRVNKAANYKQEFGNWISNLIEISLKTDQTEFAKTHRAGFPLDLPKVFIDIFSKEDDIIIDPFGGLMTVPMASESLNRKWISSELMQKYCNIGKQRLEGMGIQCHVSV